MTTLHKYSVKVEGGKNEIEVTIWNERHERVLIYTVDTIQQAHETGAIETKRFDFGYYEQ